MYRRSNSLIGTFLAALVVALVVSAIGASVAVAAPRDVSPFGLNSHMLWGYSHTEIDRELDSLQAAGASWLRIDVSWRGIETADNVYDAGVLGNLDYVVTQAAAHGIQVAPVVLAVPDWANGGAGTWTPPTDDADFGDFMKYMSARYAGRITYWELGNEVNESGFWATGRDPIRYTSFLKAGYQGVKAGSPNAKVITAGLAGADFGYVEEMYRAGAKGYFDIIGIHPYTNGRSPYAEDPEYPGQVYGGMANVKAVMDRYGDSGKTIWATELGWQTSTTGSMVSETTQASYIYDSYKRLYESFPYVTTIFIYGLRNDGTDPSAPIDNYGLLKRDYTPKAAYAAFRGACDDFQVTAPVVAETVAPTTAKLTASARTISMGRYVVLRAAIDPAAATKVRIESKPAGAADWGTVADLTTAADGTVACVDIPSVTTEYRVVTADGGVTSASVKVGVKAKVTAKSSTSAASAGSVITLSGTVIAGSGTTPSGSVSAANAGTSVLRVALQRRTGNRWVTVKTITTGANGRYATRVEVDGNSSSYRVCFSGNSTNAASESDAVAVRVR